jgi:hypothetical protein
VPVSFEELIEVLKGLPGRAVEAEIGFVDDGGEVRNIAKFSGNIEQVTQGRAQALPDHWYIWWEKDENPKPGVGMVVVRSDGYESVEVKGSGRSLEEVVTEDEDGMGTNWEVIVRQHGFVVTLLIYV